MSRTPRPCRAAPEPPSRVAPLFRADFSLRNGEHLLMWEMANEKIISEYVRQFSKRCATLEAQDAKK